MSIHPVTAAAPVVELSGGVADDLTDREVRRSITPHSGRTPVDTAAADLLDRDLAFVLFVEAGRGVDSVLYRAGPTGLRLAQADGCTDLVTPGAVAVTLSTVPAPPLSRAQAVERLLLAGSPLVFHREDDDRAAVVHRTRDGGVGQVAFPPGG